MNKKAIKIFVLFCLLSADFAFAQTTIKELTGI